MQPERPDNDSIRPEPKCNIGCPRCSIHGDESAEPADTPRGWRLTLGAAAYFLLPLALAIVGAIWFADRAELQVLAAGGGLLGGCAAAIALSRLLTETPEGPV